jgi:Fe-S-cluster containining protein
MEFFGGQQHLYFIDQDLADRVKARVGEAMSRGRDEAAVLAAASEAAALADRLIRRFESDNRLPHPIACGEGCNSCCFNQVEVTPPKALLIGHYAARHFSREEQVALMETVARALSLKAGKSIKKLACLRSQLPCPLLMDEKCSVYEVRPLVCRAMHPSRPGPAGRNCAKAGWGRANITPTAMNLSGPSAPGCKAAAGKRAVKPGSWIWIAPSRIFLPERNRSTGGSGESGFSVRFSLSKAPAAPAPGATFAPG